MNSKSSRLVWGVACLWAVGRTASAADASGDPSAESSATQTLQEVVVSAQKREERLQDVPVSVGVLSGDDMVRRSLNQLTDYANYVPGLNVIDNGTPGFTTITIRGIANVGEQTPSVGTYIDEFPVGSAAGWAFGAAQQLDLPPYDLDRLEVLRGPQGTLYGAGTTGGLVKYVLKSPSTGQFEVKGGADLETVDGASDLGYRVRAEVNAPISNNFALLVSGFYTHTPGYIDNSYPLGEPPAEKDINAFKEAGGRVALLWQPAENLSVKLNALGFWSYADNLNWVMYTTVTPAPNRGDVNIVIPGGPLGDLVWSQAFDQPVSRTFNFYSASIDWNPGPVDVISQTGWSKQANDVTRDFSQVFGPLFPVIDPTIPAGLAPYANSSEVKKFTQELRFASPQNQTVEWLVGFFYTAEKSELNELISAYTNNYEPIPEFQPYFLSALIPTTYDERAVFGDLTWHISHSFDVGGGIRYSHNDQSWVENLGGALVGGSSTIKNETSQSDTTWSGTARYHFSPDSMLYARVATGYNPGGPNGIPPSENAPSSYGPETVTSYELGVKSEFLDRRALIDAAVFYIDWHDIQVGQTTSEHLNYTGNGGEAVSKGLELTSSYAPLRGLNFGFNAAYTQSELTSLAPNVTGGLLIGYQLPFIPKWALSGTVAYDWTLSNTWQAHVGAGVHWRDVVWDGVVSSISGGGGPVSQLPSFTSADLDASLSMGKLALKAYVRNLTNTRAFQNATILNPQTWYGVPQPRTIGVGFDVNF